MTQPRPKSADRLASYRAMIAGAVRIEAVFADADGHHLMIETMGGEQEAIAIISHVCPTDNRKIMLNHVRIIADLIAMLDATGKYLYAQRAENERLRSEIERKGGQPAKDYAAECAMKCNEPGFQRFLAECHDLPMPTDGNKAGTKVRFVLAIESRKQLNTDADAAARWRAMVKNFEAWRRRG